MVQAARQFRRHATQVALVGRRVAQQHPGRFVHLVDAVGVIHQQYAGFHAADDQLVDLGQVGQVHAALLGQRLGGANLPAQHVAEHGDGEVGQAKQARFQQLAVHAHVAVLDLEHRVPQHAQGGQGGEETGQSQRQDQCAGRQVDRQHHGDADTRIVHGGNGQHGGDDVHHQRTGNGPAQMRGRSPGQREHAQRKQQE